MKLLATTRQNTIAVCASLAVLAGCATLGQINLVSEQQELQMGAEFAAQLETELPFITDPFVLAYIDSLGQEIVRIKIFAGGQHDHAVLAFHGSQRGFDDCTD